MTFLRTLVNQLEKMQQHPFLQHPLFQYKVVQHWPMFAAALVLALLLWRNPYSNRTLIPNFEPFPDSFHYITPPRCWLNGQGWELCRDGMAGVKPAVPPVYGLTLLPAFMLSNDARSFYFINVILAFISLGFLYAITQRIKIQSIAQLLIVTMFVTSYQVYWLPTLAMAENLILPLFFATIWLLAEPKLSWRTAAAVGTLAGLQYGAKFAGLPLLFGLGGVTAIRILAEHTSWPNTLKKIIALGLPLGVLFLAFGGWQTINSVVNLAALLGGKTNPTTTGVGSSAASDSWFGFSYFSANFKVYAQTVLGQSTRFLWDFTPLLSPWLSLTAAIGLIYGAITKRWRWLSLTLLASAILQVSIISLFYTSDTRYVYVLLPIALIGLIFFLLAANQLAVNKKIHKQVSLPAKTFPLALAGLLLLGIGVYSGVSFNRIKSQISLNLRYAEAPWWYLAIIEMNTYFGNLPASDSAQQPIVISPIVPYLVDLYSNNTYSLLPLDQMQDFRGHKPAVWGENDYSDLLALYQQKLAAGYPVFVAKYGLGNETNLHNSFAALEQRFTLTKVHSGCFDVCDIYQLSEKESLTQP